MKKLNILTILIFLTSSICFAQSNQIDSLLEKVNQSKKIEEKKELIKKLKEELAKKNKKEQEEASAILKAKEKLPTKKYTSPSLNK